MSDSTDNQMQGTEVRDGKFFAVISYISFLCILALLLKKENKFALFHAKQGLVLFVFESCAFIISIIPFLGWILRTIGFAVFFLVSLWGIFMALRGSYVRIPVVSKIAEKIIL
jgi:uncharacterized membrane protein